MKAKLVCESLEEWRSSKVDEGAFSFLFGTESEDALKEFINNPEDKKALMTAYIKQIRKTPKVKDALLKVDTEKQVEFAKQSLAAMEKNPKAIAPWLVIKDGQIVKGGIIGGSVNLTVGA